MKTIHVLLLAIMVMAQSAPLKAATSMSSDNEVLIIIHQQPSTPDGEPRGPVFNPFSAYQLNNQVTLESSVPFGLVSVCLSSTAGDYYTTVFDTEDGFIFIPISGLAGNYTLLLTTQSGTQYYGEFEITQ